jgi:hypothetical protein
MGCRIAMWLCYWENPLPKFHYAIASGLPFQLGADIRKYWAMGFQSINQNI